MHTRRDKSVTDLAAIRAVGDQSVALVRHDHEIEGLAETDMGQSLKASQGVLAVFEILREFVPDEDDSTEPIFVDDSFQPCRHFFSVHVHCQDTILAAERDKFFHQRFDGLLVIRLEDLQERIQPHAAEILRCLADQASQIVFICRTLIDPG